MKTPSQTHVLGLAHPPLPMVRLAFIGLGNRGVLTLQRYLQIEGVEIKALCEIRKAIWLKPKRYFGKPVIRNRTAIPDRMDGNECANGMTLISYSSVPTG